MKIFMTKSNDINVIKMTTYLHIFKVFKWFKESCCLLFRAATHFHFLFGNKVVIDVFIG